jgi:tyrosine-specific transport protein
MPKDIYFGETMSSKQIGAISLVAGTCIGSGMIALPLVLAKFGILPSIILMLVTWFFMYYTSLINLELNLQAGEGLPLGLLGRRFSGPLAELLGTGSLKLLSYALMAVFISGGSSIAEEYLSSKMGWNSSPQMLLACYSLVVAALLLLPIKILDYLNRILFIALMGVILFLLIALMASIEWSHLPWYGENYRDASHWADAIPVVFTSFGFQVIFHTMTNYCHKDASVLKKAFLWGSFIPALVYIAWTCSILGVIFTEAPAFYVAMSQGSVEVGELIATLGSIAKWESMQLFIWAISSLAIATSVLGVGVGLCDTIDGMLSNRVTNPYVRKVLAAGLAVLPPFMAVSLVPNAFIAVLGFAGMILAFIAILLPLYLFWQLKPRQLHYPQLNRPMLLALSFGVGLIVVACELWSLVE